MLYDILKNKLNLSLKVKDQIKIRCTVLKDPYFIDSIGIAMAEAALIFLRVQLRGLSSRS